MALGEGAVPLAVAAIDDGGGEEMFRAEEEEARKVMFAVTLTTFLGSSSLMVSNILGALSLLTLIYWGGATSLANFFMNELFAIIRYLYTYIFLVYGLICWKGNKENKRCPSALLGR